MALGDEQGFKRNMFLPAEEKQDTLEEFRLNPNLSESDIYVSVYEYEFDEEPNSQSDFLSAPKHGDFYVDLDGKTPAHAEVDARKLINQLVLLGVKQSHIQFYFSGGKGYHLVLPEEYFEIKDRTQLHKNYRAFAEFLKTNGVYDSLDLVVYDARRVLRLNDTYNRKGKQNKELLEGEELSMSDRMAIKPVFTWFLEPEDLTPKPVLSNDYETSSYKKPIEPFMLRLINSEPENGKRNNTCYTIALYLKDHGYTRDEALNILLSSPNSSPVEKKESAIDSAYDGDKHFGLTNNEIVHESMTQDEKIQFNVDDITNLLVPWKEVMETTRSQIDKFQKKELLSYGIDKLDNYLGMIQPTELVVVGGVSGIGKSEFVWNAAKANCLAGLPVAFIGLEMAPAQYTLRLLRNKVGVEASKFKTMTLTDDEKEKLEVSLTDMENQKLPMYFFNPKFKLSVERLDKLIKEATQKFGIRLWVIDHLHHFPSFNPRDDQTADIAGIVTAIKQMTLKYDIPIILVSHYRKITSGASPSLNSFKDSISIVQVADSVLSLNRNLITEDIAIQRRLDVSVLKSRYGMASCTFSLDFNPMNGSYKASEDFRFGLKGTLFD